MVAVATAAGVPPHRACDYVSTIQREDFFDLGGLGGLLKGQRFESLMADMLRELSPVAEGSRWPIQLEDALVPVAVTATDIQPKWKPPGPPWWELLRHPRSYLASVYLPTPRILHRGSMVRAARASATFPVLFEPVGWIDAGSDRDSHNGDDGYSVLIDGGVFDWAGYHGLEALLKGGAETPTNTSVHVLNLAVGGFLNGPPGPEAMSEQLGVPVDSVLSVSIRGLPSCGPFAMDQGPVAIRATRSAVRAAMDRPLVAADDAHFVLDVDASPFVEATDDQKEEGEHEKIKEEEVGKTYH